MVSPTAGKPVDPIVTRFLAATDYASLADVFDVPEDKLKYYVYNPKGRKYQVFQIPKKGGGKRTIYTPATALKILQGILSDILYKIYRPRHAAKGFVIGESVVTNAQVHASRNGILNIDLKDFFDTINYGRVYGLFRSAPFNFNNEVAACLGKMVCFRSKLPQGAPTSPIISNMISLRLDKDLQALAKETGMRYSRYADDITFSTIRSEFPPTIAEGTGRKVVLGEPLEKVITQNGFSINHAKTRIYYKTERQVVTGLVVNEGVNVPRRYIRHIRGIIHSVQKHGLAASQAHFESYYTKHKHKSKGTPLLANYLQGKMAFLRQVKGKNDQVYKKLLQSLHDLFPLNFEAPVDQFKDLVKEWEDLEKKPKKLTAIQRGFALQTFFFNLFGYFEVPALKSYIVPGTTDQIDAGFKFDSQAYVVECKWTKNPVAGNPLDRLYGVISRLGHHIGGMFFSVNGWTEQVNQTLIRNPQKNIFLFHGDDVRDLLAKNVTLPDLLRHKIDGLNFGGVAYTRYTPPKPTKAKAAKAAAKKTPAPVKKAKSSKKAPTKAKKVSKKKIATRKSK